MAKLVIKNLYKSYNSEGYAVENVSFAAEDGEFIVLVGPSGCGKTTILRMIAGLEDITQGEMFFDDELVNEISPRDRDIGMVFQNYALYPHLDVFENIAFPLKIRKTRKSDIKKRVGEIVDMLNLNDYIHRKPKELSGGQRQRVALGRAIVRNPRMFLFDEPLSNLDAKLRVQMRTEICKLQRSLGITCIYVTHDQVEAMTMGTRLAVLNNGILQQFDTPEKIYKEPKNVFVAGFIGSPQMNFIEGKMSYNDGIKFVEENNGIRFDLEESFVNNHTIEENENIILGIRPENISISKDESNKIAFDANIVNIENIGHEALVYFETGDKLRSLRTINISKLTTGFTKLTIVDPKKIRIFNKQGESV